MKVCKKTDFSPNFAVLFFKVSAWLSNHAVCTTGIGAEDRSILFYFSMFSFYGSGTVLYTDTGVHDGGRYSCEIETDSAEPLAVVHIVEILGKFKYTITQIILEVAGTTYKLCVFLSTIVFDDCDPKPREIA
jgi:hypothetical protein